MPLIPRFKITLKLFIFPCLIFICFIFANCEKEPAPTYLTIENIVLQPGAIGSASSNIVDAWIFVNDNSRGVFEMPTTFPLLDTGKIKLTVQGGIKMNGINTTRVSYPFYSNYVKEIDLSSNTTQFVFPKVEYVAATKIALLEDFEFTNIFSETDRVFNNDAFEGTASGKMRIPLGTNSVISFSTNRFSIPFNTTAAFLELDYKNNRQFNVSIRAFFNNSAQEDRIIKLNVTEKDEWNKIYINFTPDINRVQADSYELVFQYFENDNNEPVNIFFDNIKFIYL